MSIIRTLFTCCSRSPHPCHMPALVIIWLVFVGHGQSLAADANNLKGLVLLQASFDHAITVDTPNSIPIEIKGGAILTDGVSGGALSLKGMEHIVLRVGNLIKSDEGSISLWIRPHWNFYSNNDGEFLSHTFLSFTWNDSKKGYFALSDGWWEPLGDSFTYFVLNNAKLTHVKGKYLYVDNEWTHIVCTWKSGLGGEIILYVNGKIVGRSFQDIEREGSTTDKIYIGSDKGSSLSKSRWADCDVDELTIYKKALSTEQVNEIRKQQDPLWETRSFSYFNNYKDEPQLGEAGSTLDFRAIFDEGEGWMSANGAIKTIQRIKEGGFNVFIPCVWHGKGTRYPCDVAPTEQYFPPSEDPLDRLIKISQKNGIRIMPWFTVALRQREFLTNYYSSETPEKAFDLHRAEFRDFIVNMILDVVRRYDIDGVNLDFIRTMGICKCNYCIEEYKRTYNRNLLHDIKQNSYRNALEPHYQQWQDQAVEDIVRRVAEEGRRIRKNLLISVDGNPIPKFMASDREGRQEIKWANEGLVDIIFCMDYSKKPDFDLFEIVRKEMDEPGKLLFLLGNYELDPQKGLMPMCPTILKGNIEYVQRRWRSSGVGVYYYGQLSEAQIRVLSLGPFVK